MLAVCFIILSVALLVCAFAIEEENNLLATVGNVAITKEEISKALGSSLAANKYKKTRSASMDEKEVLHILILYEIINQMAEQEGISLSDEEVQKIKYSQNLAFDLIYDAIQNGSADEKESAEMNLQIITDCAEGGGMSLDEYKEYVIQTLIFSEKLSQLADAKFDGNKDAVRAYAAENYDNFMLL